MGGGRGGCKQTVEHTREWGTVMGTTKNTAVDSAPDRFPLVWCGVVWCGVEDTLRWVGISRQHRTESGGPMVALNLCVMRR